MRACCTAATWRCSNSLWVTISPLTATMTRSSTSAGAESAAASRLGRKRARTLGRFMVHLGAGHEARDEITAGTRRARRLQPGADLWARLVQRQAARRRARLEPQHVMAEARL